MTQPGKRPPEQPPRTASEAADPPLPKRGGILPSSLVSKPPKAPASENPNDRAWVWWFLAGTVALIVLGGAIAAKVDMIGDPRTIVQATSDAVVIQPATIIDLVKLARPRFGLHDPTRVFDGIRLDPPASADTMLAGLGFTLDHGADLPAHVIQRFEITPACQVSIEQMVDGWVRIDIRSLASDNAAADEACQISAEVLLATPEAAERGDMTRYSGDALVRLERPASMQFRPLDALRFRSFDVTGLGFTTTESGSLESAIRGAVVSLPDHGVERDTVLYGDRLTLGGLNGEITELYVNDGIHTLFKGTAAEPAIADRRLKPSLLEQGVHAEDLRIILAIIVGFASVVMAVFQVVLRS